MKKLSKNVVLMAALLLSTSVFAGIDRTSNYVAELDAKSALTITREIIFLEMMSNIPLLPSFLLDTGNEIFGVDELDSESTLREKPKYFARQTDQNDSSDG